MTQSSSAASLTRVRLARAVTFFSALIGIPAALVAIVQYFDPPHARAMEADVTGHWIVWNTIESTTHDDFLGLRVGYRLFLRQEGKRLTGSAEKWWENESEVRGKAHTTVTLEGSLRDRSIHLLFVEQGTQRETRGEYSWTATEEPDRWSGTFTSTAAASSGPSELVRARQEQTQLPSPGQRNAPARGAPQLRRWSR